MIPNLSEMSISERKTYISKHRSDPDAFQAAMDVVMSRRNPSNLHPYAFTLENPEVEVEALLREKLKRSE